MSTLTSTAPAATRTPVPVVAASVLTLLLGLVGGYGAFYFSGLGGGITAEEATFVVTYESFVALGLVSAVALLRRSPYGRAGTAAYATFMVIFTIFKLVSIQEWEAMPFGVVALVVLVLVTGGPARRYAPR